MLHYIESHAATLYALTFTGAMIGVVIWEAQAPRRQPVFSHWIRWFSNFGIHILNSLILHLLLPLSAIAAAARSTELGWGLFNSLSLPALLVIVPSILSLDSLHYLKHVLLHRIPLLWRFHRVHHDDLDYDFTTGIRFHPFEIILNAMITLGAIVALGIPAYAVVIYEISLVAVTFIVHGNIKYPARADGIIRAVLVTPDMHRIHHSSRVAETDSNYGVIFSIWDRLFKTHVQEPHNGHEGMALGLTEFRERKHQFLPWMLACPFLAARNQSAKTGQEDAGL